MEEKKLAWKECAALLDFLVERGDCLSNGTIDRIQGRVLSLLNGAAALDNVPEPY